MTKLSDDQFAAEFDTFTTSLFRIDRTSRPYARERPDFERWLAGDRRPPTEYEWLAPWFAKLARWRAEGKDVQRVRILPEHPTAYQLWLLWGSPCMNEAGDSTWYMTEATALACGLPEWEWLLFDDARVIELETKTLITNATVVAMFRNLRDVALANAMTPEDAAMVFASALECAAVSRSA